MTNPNPKLERQKPYVGCWACGHRFYDYESDPFFPYPTDQNVFCPKCKAPWVLVDGD